MGISAPVLLAPARLAHPLFFGSRLTYYQLNFEPFSLSDKCLKRFGVIEREVLQLTFPVRHCCLGGDHRMRQVRHPILAGMFWLGTTRSDHRGLDIGMV
jgi:hypothetical protein